MFLNRSQLNSMKSTLLILIFAAIGGAQNAGTIHPYPSGLVVTASSESSVKLSFKCGGNADYHRLIRNTAGGANSVSLPAFAESLETPKPSCFGGALDTTVLPQTNYCYKVEAINSTHHAYSSPVCLTTPAP